MQQPLQQFLIRRPRSSPLWARWSFPVGLICVVTLLRVWSLGEHPGWPYLTFFPVVVISSLWFGPGSGYIAGVLSSVVAAWAFVPPVFSFATLDDPTELAGFLLSVAVNVLVAWLIGALHRIIGEQHVANARLEEASDSLSRSEAEKTLLLDEFSHRLRNDYQRLIGVVMVQERLTGDADNAREALAMVRRRIEAAASLNSRLTTMTSTGRLLFIDSRAFLTGVIDDLSTTTGLLPVILGTNAESHPIPAQQALSIGLIVNETITNALKYAFPDERSGRVTTTFQRNDEGFLLTIADDGIGMPADSSPQGTGLGSRLIRSLAANLAGTVCFKRLESGGTAFEVRFPAEVPSGQGPRNERVSARDPVRSGGVR